ncbi:helix-turn-helix domain-containing protein [Qipengyuania mesophila]|uniref:helix-turn-helix domain-containing protein n=1 Tax=Qipengyuania mesophila TaxID=2867246 RepID=UPI00351245AF
MTTLSHPFEQFAERVLPSTLGEDVRCDFHMLARCHPLAREASLDFAERSEQIVFVGRGATKLVAHASESRDQVVAFHFAGEVFTVPEPDNYSYSVCALRECELLTFASPEFLRLAEREAEIMRQLLDSTKLSLRRCREKTIALGRKTAGERVAVFLLGMARRIGVEQDGRVALELPMSRRDISESLGLTIETVSRQLSKLKDDGVIETTGRSGIVLLDCPDLQRRAGFLKHAA